MLDARNLKNTNVDVDTLKADLIKYNPSLFTKDGKVKDNAKWDRLDLPKDLKAKYGKSSAGKELPKTEQEAPAPRGYVPIDSSLPGIPDPKARFNPKQNLKEANLNKPAAKQKEAAKPESETPQKTPEDDIPKFLRRPKEKELEFPKFKFPQHDWD